MTNTNYISLPRTAVDAANHKMRRIVHLTTIAILATQVIALLMMGFGRTFGWLNTLVWWIRNHRSDVILVGLIGMALTITVMLLTKEKEDR